MDQAQAFNLDTGSEFLSGQRNFVDMETLKAVEIVKGPASSLYGSDAIGGMVAYQTKDPADMLNRGDDSFASIKAGYVSVNEGFTETVTLANRSGKLESMVIYTRRDHKETDTNGGANIEGDNRGQANPSDTGLNNLLSKVQYQINDDHRIGFTGEFFESKTDSQLKSGGIIASGSTGEDKASRYRIGFEHQWDANLALFDALNWQMDFQRSKTDMSTFLPAYTSSTGTKYDNRVKDYLYEEEGFQLSAQLSKNVMTGSLEHNLVYRFNYSDTDVDNISSKCSKTTGKTIVHNSTGSLFYQTAEPGNETDCIFR